MSLGLLDEISGPLVAGADSRPMMTDVVLATRVCADWSDANKKAPNLAVLDLGVDVLGGHWQYKIPPDEDQLIAYHAMVDIPGELART